MTPEEELIRACQRGHPPSQEALYRRYWSFAMSVCLRYTPTREDALELAHDGFLRAFQAIDRVDPERPFRPWFRRVLVRCAIDRHRSMRRYHAAHVPEADPPEIPVEPDHTESLEVDEILALLRALPDVQRDVFNLYEVDGHSHDEIADLLGIAASTSRAHLARAKQRLRDLYHQHIEAAP